MAFESIDPLSLNAEQDNVDTATTAFVATKLAAAAGRDPGARVAAHDQIVVGAVDIVAVAIVRALIVMFAVLVLIIVIVVIMAVMSCRPFEAIARRRPCPAGFVGGECGYRLVLPARPGPD
jgi:hypothetical protein